MTGMTVPPPQQNFRHQYFNLTLMKNTADGIWNEVYLDSLTEVSLPPPDTIVFGHSPLLHILSCHSWLLPLPAPRGCFRFLPLVAASASCLSWLLPLPAPRGCFR